MGLLSAFAEKAKACRVIGAQVYQDGRLVDRLDFDAEIRRNQYSVSKSFTATAIGFGIAEGILSLEERMVDAFRDELPEDVPEALEALTLHHLLTMETGQDAAYLMGGQRPFLKERDWVRYCLARPFVTMPGTKFQYTNVGPYLAGVLLQRRTGMTLTDYLMPRLFAPLEIHLPTWEVDPMGYTMGAGGLFLCVSEIARYAMVHLQGGQWKGQQLIPREWVEACSTRHVAFEDGEKGYGYLFWLGTKGTYRADGAYGQYGIVVPGKNAVIAINSENHGEGDILALVDEAIMPLL